MKKKVRFLLALGLCFCFFMLTACQGEEGNGQPSEGDQGTKQEQKKDAEKQAKQGESKEEANGAADPGESPKAPEQTTALGEEPTPGNNLPVNATGEEQEDSHTKTALLEEKPEPVNPKEIQVDKTNTLTCTMSIDCSSVFDNMDKLDQSKLEVIPKDGVIYAPQKVSFYEGETAFDVLLRETRANKIHLEFESTPAYDSQYVEGISNLYEFDCGELSGWMYRVNDWFPNYGFSRYQLKDGDKIEWIYTCDLGRDVGENWIQGTE